MDSVRKQLNSMKVSETAKIVEHVDPTMEESADMEVDDGLEQSAVCPQGRHNGPIVILLLGLAGAGKTTLTQRLCAYIMSIKKRPYIVNLDPACKDPPFPVRIDIRDTLDFKQIKKQYNLGPNGGIVTSLNLFATKFNDVMDILKTRERSCDYILIDTPGQIEVFMWSASGQIIMQSLGAVYPTVISYVTDLKLNVNPITFISNMTYASSIIYKSRLPMVLALNKADQVDPTYATEWITDFEAFQASVADLSGHGANLASSLCLALDEMYGVLDHVPVSAYTGAGMKEFFAAVHKSADEYESVFRPYFEKLKAHELKKAVKRKAALAARLQRNAESSVFSIPGSMDGGQGLNLRQGNDEDDEDTSSDEEDDVRVRDAEESEEGDFRSMMETESKKRTDKAMGVNPDA